LADVGDIIAYEEQIKCYRPFWCWRVRGWGPNTSNDSTYCSRNSEGILGDEAKDYTGTMCFETIGPWELDPPLSYAEWSTDGITTASAVRIQYQDEWTGEAYKIRAYFNIDPGIFGFTTGAVHCDYEENSSLQWSFPTTVAAVFGGPFCNLIVQPLDVTDPNPQDPNNPSEWSPWCRPQSGAGMNVDLW